MQSVESRVDRWFVESGSSREIPFGSDGVFLQADEPDTSVSYWLHVDGPIVFIEHQKNDLRPTTFPLGKLSPMFIYWEETDNGIFRRSFQVIVNKKDGSNSLEVTHTGSKPIVVSATKPALSVDEQPEMETQQMRQLAKSTLLKSWPFLPKEEIDAFSKALKPEHYKDGDIILQEGDPAEPPNDKMFFIAQGTVEVIQQDTHVGLINTKSPAPYFGERALVNKAPRNATIKAVGDVLIFAFDGEGLRQLAQSSPEVKGLIDLIIKIRDGQRIIAYDLAQAVNLQPEIQTPFSYWLNYLSQFLNEEGSSGYYLQEANSVGMPMATAENLVVACGYLIKEGLVTGNSPVEITDRILQDPGLLNRAVQNCERAGKPHEANTLQAIITQKPNQKPHMIKIVTVLAAEYFAQQR